MMKKISWFLLVGIVGIVWSCDQRSSKGTTITVNTDKTAPTGGQVVLYGLEEGRMQIVDTLKADGDNKYETELPLSEDKFFRVDVFRQQFVNLILDGSESNVSIEFSGSTASIMGSDKSVAVKQMDDLMAKSRRDMQQLSQEAGQANKVGDQATVQAIINQYNNLQKNNETLLKGIIREANPSLASVYGLNYLDIESNFTLFDSVATMTAEILPDNFLVTNLNDQVARARVLAIGQQAPDFSMPDLDGENFGLSDLRGKYVLIDFWAAWCKPCRAENPNVVRMYDKYGGDKFEILGVSLDRTRDAWVRAINDDGLMWKHVSDLKYFNSAAAALYSVSSIPATFLVDPEGKIIAKNLRGPSLEAKLQELFD